MKSWMVLVSLVVVCAMLTGCQGSPEDDTAGPRAKKDAPKKKVIELKAPKAAADLWLRWNGKYVLYAHRTAGISSFSDLAGKSITCAYINTDRERWVCDNILGDMSSLQKAGGISATIGIQNNVEAYGKRLVENKTSIGFMSAGLAEHYKLKDEAKLVRFVIVE